ncbi:MAG: acetate kinase [Oscillospiraceae bacterium]|nr:acetate kinase [Oscillospiraceae bacterium]
MKVLVINAGSSSLKYQLFDMNDESVLCKGNCERIGVGNSFIGYKNNRGQQKKVEVEMNDHTQAFMQVKAMLTDPEVGVISDLSEVEAVGHRVVQGGSIFHKSTVIDDKVLEDIDSLSPLAPLHNPGAVQGVKAAQSVFGKDTPMVAVFDTSFHSTMPEKAYMYAVPYKYYEKYSIRRYGFHGTSHRYVSSVLAELLGKDIKDTKLITCHIGNGSSITAIDGGKVIDTSMGLTPLDGFMMGTRSGSLDPSVVTYIMEKEHLSASDMDRILNKESGLFGISGVSSDDRDITKAESEGNEHAHLAHEMLYYQIAKTVGSYYVALGGCDGIAFTAGLGEHQAGLRATVLEYLGALGVKLDKEANDNIDGMGIITTEDSAIPCYVIPTNEELVIARDTKDLVG